MAATTHHKRDVLLVGSVPLADAHAVFTTASHILGDRLSRIPDGETGVRTNWIGWQVGVFMQNPQLEPVTQEKRYDGLPQFQLKPGIAPEELTFANLGYADAAIASYTVFRQLQEAGEIGAATKFQVSLPTPLAPLNRCITVASQAAVEPAYEARMLEELAMICAHIPHNHLAIQWDIAIEMAIIEGVWPTFFEDVFEGCISRIAHLSAQVPDGVELGYHLCYGDAMHQHFVQPADTTNLVRVANAISERVTRQIAWIHMPVPRERSDDAYFAPLAGLHLHPETTLFLGVVHLTDGIAGTEARIAAAARAVPDFGIATECGFGRRPPETVVALLDIHNAV